MIHTTISFLYIAVGLFFIINAAITHAKAYEYYFGVLCIAWGAMEVMPSIIPPGPTRTAVQICLLVLLVLTGFLWWKSRPGAKTVQNASGGTTASR